MPAADAAWLHMDRPTNPMVVNSLVMLAAAPDRDAVAEVLERRLLGPYPRFRRRVSESLGGGPGFEDDASFDLANHLHFLTLPAPGDQAALEALIGELITAPLDRGRPLWDAYVIEGPGESAAMLWRIHHCIADGVALTRVLLTICDEDAADGAEEVGDRSAEEATATRASEQSSPGILRRLTGVPGDALSAVRKVGGATLHEGMETLAHPDHLGQLARAALRDASTAAKLIASPADAPSDLRAPLTGTRGVAWAEPFSLARVKDAAQRRRVTVNDLLVSALAAALHEVLGANGALPEEIHALVPFNLRSPDEAVPSDLGNDFALVLLELPVGEVGPAERLREVSSRMDAIKRSHEAPIAFGLIGAIGLTPPWVEDRLINFFTDKASLVVTNVPGPDAPLSFAGSPITGVLVWAPCSGSLGMTVSILSYAGEVTVGFMADTALIADPGPLARAYERELRRLGG